MENDNKIEILAECIELLLEQMESIMKESITGTMWFDKCNGSKIEDKLNEIREID